MLTLQTGLMMFFAAAAGGLVQAVTGFGSGIVMMVFLPLFLPILQGSAVSTLVNLPMMLSMIWTYRRHVKLEYMLKPIAFYMVVSTVSIRFAAGRDLSSLKLFFGLFLIALSIYFLIFSEKLKIEASWLTAAICGIISGIASGFFGIGGPPMVIYYMALTGGDKLVYLGTIQTFFLITSLYNTVVRFLNGIFTLSLIPFIILGTVGGMAGKVLGTKIVSKINTALMKKLVYAFLGVSGLINVISNLPK